MQPTPLGDADDGGIPGMGVPYEDFIPFIPMVKDPATGQWRNAYESEGGYTPDPDPNPEEVGRGDIIPEYRTLPWLEGDGEEGEQTPPGDGDGVRLPGMEGPFVDVMPVMVQDPTTGEWLVKVTDPATGELRSPEPGEQSPNPNLSDLFDPTAPGPTLAPDLFNPNSPGPTLDPRLLLDPDSPGPTIDPALLDLTEPEPTIDPALLDPNSPGPTVDPALLDSNSPGPTVDSALLDPSAPGPTIDPAQLEHGIAQPSSGVAEPVGVTDYQDFTDPSLTEPSTTPRDDFDDPSTLG